ncbi:hypothetical protein SCHPADRAFT_902845 [Schizopora paradoxa]|uniref:Uncharacterized protein n=1 Tax=Schizopora paradoxa TaxID=27342 RepID=A0A0H2RSQ4_9AGAM|nr:hypothetical protein SCHPADRAFT_902845 [Schizopora paradoxa]
MNPLDGRVDTMLVPPGSLVSLSTSCAESPVDFDGHYPLLGGVDSTGRPLYISNLQNIALIREDNEGAFDRQSRPLVLKHSPSDTLPPYPEIPRGAMDQTGPPYWLEVWPTRDSDSELLDDLEKCRGVHRDWYHNSEGRDG